MRLAVPLLLVALSVALSACDAYPPDEANTTAMVPLDTPGVTTETAVRIEQTTVAPWEAQWSSFTDEERARWCEAWDTDYLATVTFLGDDEASRLGWAAVLSRDC